MNVQRAHDMTQEAGRENVWGFLGTGADPFVGKGGGKLFFIDASHSYASDNNDGTDPGEPMATLQGLIDRTAAYNAGTATRAPVLEEMDTVYVCSDITESVVTGTSATMPQHVNIVGVAGSQWGPTWESDAAASPCLTGRCEGWVVQGFHFVPPASASAIKLEWVPGSSYTANRWVIQNNEFDGEWTGKYGIDLSGAPYDTVIRGNRFREMKQAGGDAYAIICTNSANANPYMNIIEDNVFWENDNHIGSLNNNKSFNLSVFKGNVFHEGVLITATLILDLRGGSVGKNIVVGNYFCGDYSNAGGYYANAAAPGNWVGNIAEDVAEAEVADNGFTVAVPAA